MMRLKGTGVSFGRDQKHTNWTQHGSGKSTNVMVGLLVQTIEKFTSSYCTMHTSHHTKPRRLSKLSNRRKNLYSTLTISRHIKANNILAEEQKGCKKGFQGCKEQIVIDSEPSGKTQKIHRIYGLPESFRFRPSLLALRNIKYLQN